MDSLNERYKEMLEKIKEIIQRENTTVEDDLIEIKKIFERYTKTD